MKHMEASYFLRNPSTGLIPVEEISGIYLCDNIIQTGVIAVGDDGIALLLEFAQIIDHLAAKESDTVFQGRFIDDNGGPFGFETFHDPLYRALAEVI